MVAKNCMKKNIYSLSALQRHLHVVALMLDEKNEWNAETLAKFFSNNVETDDSVSGKTFRVDLKKSIKETLGISFNTSVGRRYASIETEIDSETLHHLLNLYTGFVVHDSSRNIALHKLIERKGKNILPLLAYIHFAAESKKKIKFTYTGNDMKIREVHINPYHIVIRDTTLYLIGKRDKDETVGPYIFDRIENCKVLTETFEDEIPPVEDYLQHSHGLFIWNYAPAITMTIRYSSKLENIMRDNFDHLKPQIKHFSDHLEMSFLIHDYESVCRQLFFYGSDVEIISPPEVREYMIEMLVQSMSVYKK